MSPHDSVEFERLRQEVRRLLPLYATVEKNDLAIVVTDRQGIICYVNARQLASSGYAAHELLGRNANIFSAGQTLPDTYAELWETILAGRAWHGEMMNRRKNGELRRERLHITPIRDAQGDIDRFFCIKEEDLCHPDEVAARFPVDRKNAPILPGAAYPSQRDDGFGTFVSAIMPIQLQDAVDRQEFLLHFQPQISLLSGEVIACEALLRWQHPERGLLMPGDFLTLAEECGMIVAIDQWVMRSAMAQLKKWQTAGLARMRMAVNLSGQHFRDDNFPDVIAALLAETGIDPHGVQLELTESAMMSDASKAVRVVERLNAMGIAVALDHFGTGYSSLTYLSRFAIDQLKIDPSFIHDVTTNPVNASIATTIIAMAHKLGKTVVADGVETEVQMNFLRRHDCDAMQGSLVCRPSPATEIVSLLRQGRLLVFGLGQQADNQSTLLLVDDEPNVLNALKRLLRRENYRILTASSGLEALDMLAVNTVQVIISDQRMPEMSGVELLSRVKEIYPDTVRIILSGYSDLSTVTDAVNRGAIWKYLSKPWDDDALRDDVRQAFRRAAESAAKGLVTATNC